MLQRIKTVFLWILEPFRLSFVSLAILRMGLGIVQIVDTWWRIPYINDFYTDTSILPRDALVQLTGGQHTFSILNASGNYYVQLAFAVITIVIAILLLVGYKTRMMTILSFIMIISYDARNPMISSGADLLIRMTTLWAMFLPLNKVYSMDRLLGYTKELTPEEYKNGVLTPATIALTLQICIVYFSTVYHKSQPVWRESFLATYYALSLEDFRLPLGTLVYPYYNLLKGFTVMTIVFEFMAPLLILNPLYNRYTRLLGVFMICSLHMGFGNMLMVGIFPYIGIASALALIPHKTYTYIDSWIRNIYSNKPVLNVYYDDDCGICTYYVRALKMFKMPYNTVFIPLHKNMDVLNISLKEDSWIAMYSDSDTYFTKVDVLKNVLYRSPITFFIAPILAFPPIRYIGNVIYKLFAKYRKAICKIPNKDIDMPSEAHKGLFNNILYSMIGALLLFNTGMFVNWVGYELRPDMFVRQPWMHNYARWMRLDQAWNMFSPPPTADGWITIEGTLNDGTKVDVWRYFWDTEQDPYSWSSVLYGRERAVNTEYTGIRPSVPMNKTMLEVRWHKYLRNLLDSAHESHRLYFGRYLCRTWNNEHTDNDKKLATFTIYFMQETTKPDYVFESAKPITISNHICDSNK